MNKWKTELNRLAVGFWCETESLDELPKWVDLACAEYGEVHPLMWELLSPKSYEAIKTLIIKISKDLNSFEITSWESEPYAQDVLAKAINSLIEEEMRVQDFCKLVTLLDANYNCDLAGVEHPNLANIAEDWWLGDLWDCCDWCDSSWNHGNSPELIKEAKVISEKLANKAFQRTSR
jgi:hypothetical protein